MITKKVRRHSGRYTPRLSGKPQMTYSHTLKGGVS